MNSHSLTTMTLRVYNFISFLLLNLRITTFMIFVFLALTGKTYFIEWTIGGSFNHFTLRFVLDLISALFLCVVFFISGNVVYYRRSYISSDKDADRFIYLVLRFVISIFFLIISPNIITILLGWDGLGLTSYALVIYYPTKKSRRAGIITVIRNRVGDICLLIAIAWFRVLGDYNYFTYVIINDFEIRWWLSFLIVIAATTKRAQIPFSAWLPAAIAAPTPVSALVHSSTLVTAGVYLLIRFGTFNEGRISIYLFFISVVTIFMSGLVAVFEYDLKKVIALSTLRQLAVIMFSISLGLYLIAFFHLIIHALFKAILFLCAGAMIHGQGGTQDIRNYGGQVYSYPIISVCLNIANLSLCGIPFISGFYSKDLIVEIASQGAWNQFLIFIIFISLGLTVIYRIRLVYLSLVTHTRRYSFTLICDLDWVIVGPILLLSLTSLFSGPFLSYLLFITPSLILLPFYLKIGALLVIVLSIFISYRIRTELWGKFYVNYFVIFMGSICFLPFISGQSISRVVVKQGISVLKSLDLGWLESCSTGFLSSFTVKLFTSGSTIQSNRLKNHFLVLVIWLLILLWLIYFWNMQK